MQRGEVNVKQEQIQDILFNREIGWKEIIYDLINTEQLNPWDVDITILTDKYIIKINELKKVDFFISSKVLLAASFLLRIKSEILLNKYIKSIDEILFGKRETPTYKLEKIELDERIPELVPRSPMPRFKKVTLKELMESLSKAVNTENRRIKKEIINKNALRESGISLPKRKFSLKDKINEIFVRLKSHFEKNEQEKKINYNKLIIRGEKASAFSPLLHLEQQNKIWLEQNKPFESIYIWEKKTFIKHNGNPYKELRGEEFKE